MEETLEEELERWRKSCNDWQFIAEERLEKIKRMERDAAQRITELENLKSKLRKLETKPQKNRFAPLKRI